MSPTAQFLITIGTSEQLEEKLNGRFLAGHKEPRFAVVGRSNVGKSTLINALLKARVAQVSNSPGKTRCLHFYRWLDEKLIVADLPGYGFAKVPVGEKERWTRAIDTYLREDESLCAILLLLDGRHGPTDLDRDALKYLRGLHIPLLFVMTKLDAIKTQSDRHRRKKEIEKDLIDEDVAWVSSKTGAGLLELCAKIRELRKNKEVQLLEDKEIDAPSH